MLGGGAHFSLQSFFCFFLLFFICCFISFFASLFLRIHVLSPSPLQGPCHRVTDGVLHAALFREGLVRFAAVPYDAAADGELLPHCRPRPPAVWSTAFPRAGVVGWHSRGSHG